MWENRVLFLDGEALVIDKPAGLAMHPGPRTQDSLEDFLNDLRFGFQRLPQPVHRLDRDTSGCLLLARNPKVHKRFGRAFEQGRITKCYMAIVNGVPAGEAGIIDMPLGKRSSAGEGWRMVPDPSGKRALSRWRLISEKAGRACILFEPETGRTHQIRVHAAEGLRCPIVGDPVYGAGGEPMLLHALSLEVEREGRPPVKASAPLPLTFTKAGFDAVL